MFGLYSRLFPSDPLGLRQRRTLAKNMAPPEPISADHDRDRYRSKAGFILTDLICAALPQDQRFTIIDGGAREVAVDPRWRGYPHQRLRFYGFEADAAEADRLNRRASRGEPQSRYFPIGLWSGQELRTFYVTQSSGGCSLYPVNNTLTDRWKMQNATSILLAKEAMRVERTEQIQVDSLDSIAAKYDLAPIDFIKLNVQGAELEILRGASKILPAVLGAQLEVSFVESYVDRPLFSDVDSFMRAKDFSFFDIIGHHYLGRTNSPVTVRHLPALSDILHGQFIEGHAVYFRDPIDLEQRGRDLSWASVQSLLKLASIAEVYHQIEFAIEVLDWSVSFLRLQGDRSGSALAAEVLREGTGRYLRYMA